MFQIKKVVTPKTSKYAPKPQDVERYVEKFDRNTQSPLERKSKSFVIARLYYDAKDYVQAKRRLEEYLSIQDRDYRVHNLMGEIQEALENYPEALSAYKRSLELCSTQKDILIKVISLCCKCPLDPLRAKVWADKGSRFCPGHPAVFELKWCIMSLTERKDFEQMEVLLADELTRRAREPSLHIKLVQIYLEAESYKRAFMHCQSVEKTSAFDGDLAWLETACNVFNEYRLITKNSLTACLCYALTLCKLMNLHMKLSTSRIVQPILRRFDATVLEFCQLQHDDVQLSLEWKDCLSEMKGQLYLHATVFILKLAQEGTIGWMKANRMASVFLVASWDIEAPKMTSKLFSRHSPLKRQKSSQMYDWSILACCRFSQTGHLILSMESQFGEEWLKDCLSDFCTEQGRRKLLEYLFSQTNDNTYLASDEHLLNVEVYLPEPQNLVQYDEVTVSEHAQDLHLIIWLGLHWDNIKEHMKPGVGVMVGRLFEGISLDVKNMTNCHFSSMCLRDVEVFIYGVIRSSKSLNVECSRAEDALSLLPVGICTSLVTEQEQEWWYAAYGLYTGKVGTQSAAKLKVVMQKGLEVLRCLRNHGIDPRILIYIAIAFWEKALSVQSTKEIEYDYQDHWQSLQNRAVYYMKEALRILGIYKKNKTIPFVENPLIPPLAEPLLPDAINDLLIKNYQKLGESAMLTGNLQDALTYFDQVNTLQSFHTQAQIYIRLAATCDTDTLTGEKDQLFYTTKAKEKLVVCINHSGHAPEFQHTLVEQLRKLETGSAATLSKPSVVSSKKCLDFEEGDLGIPTDSSHDSFANSGDVSSMFERSMLQDQLEAKEKENRLLKQALAIYKAHVDLQQRHQQQQPQQEQQEQHFSNQHPMVMTTPRYVMPHPPLQVTPQMIHNSNSLGSLSGTPVMGVNGLETPADMWWDSFSPQPSFEKGYFAGLAQHVEQVREESGEGEAPTLRDPTTPTPVSEKKVTPNVSINSAGTPAVESDDIYVEPVVKLTSKSDLVTGEEDEVTKFVHRAKLYRFDKDTLQWKERGLGDVKILLNEKNKKTRITMRREAVFRVCCNHFITPDMCLETKANANAAWTWFTPADAAEGEVRSEQFTIKFKTQDIADEFKEAFLACQKMISDGDVSTSLPVSEPIPIVRQQQQPAPFTFQVVQTPPSQSGFTGFNFGAAKPPTTQVFHPPRLSHYQQGENSGTLPQFQPNELPPNVQSSNAGSAHSHPASTTFSLFSFKAPEAVITESSSGKPIFSFAASPQATNQVNPFLDKPFLDNDAVSYTKVDSLSNFKPNAFKEVEDSSAGVTSSPFQNFSFKLPPAASRKDSQADVISPATMSHFSGFSFSPKPDADDLSKKPAETKTPSVPLTQNSPMMASLLKDKPKTPPKQSGSPKPEAIPGMNKLPVFEKGLVETGIDPSSFWTSGSPQKPFFTGNNTGLDAIGHKEEPRVVDEEEFIKDAIKASNELTDEAVEQFGDAEYYYGGGYEYYGDGEYFGEEFYGDYEDYEYDPGDDDLDNYDNEYQPSKASSGRRDSAESIDDENYMTGRQVEDRFNIQKKNIPTVIDDVINEEVTLTYESKPTFAQKMKAAQLQLPSTFYLYEQKPDCPGCYGCIDDFIPRKTLEDVSGQNVTAENKPESSIANSFGFGEATASFASLASSLQVLGNESSATTPFTFGSKSGPTSFAALATSPSQGFGGISGSFSGAGAQLFSSKTGGDGEAEDSYDPHYDAIIQVDKLENVKTGEEDDEVLFKHRAKLYRFEQQWKERGVGDLKLTRNVKTGYCRVLMRRDMIYKLCANHAVMPNMDVKPLSTSDRSAVWFTPSDYSDGMPPVAQNFCAKFKNKSVVDEFMKEFENCKELMRIKLESEEKGEITSDEPSCQQTKNEQASAGIALKFALKPGQWECTTCLVRNESHSNNCVACNSQNPNGTETTSKNISEVFKPPVKFGEANAAPIIFGTNAPFDAIAGHTEFTSGSKPFFSFGATQFTNNHSPFHFGVKDEQPEKAAAGDDPTELTSPGKYNNNEDLDIQVEAIVEVQKLGKVTTGEELEETLFANRGKLFRFDSEAKQWKEKGLGEVKLSRNKIDDTCRVLMRREQIFKLCANHAIRPDMELKPLNKSDKAWVWFTPADFSDDEAKPEQLALRFKSREIAIDFKEKFESCKEIVGNRRTCLPQQVEDSETSCKGKKEELDSSKQKVNIFAKFAPKPGSWTCETCLVPNEADSSTCVACTAPNPSIPNKTDTTFRFDGKPNPTPSAAFNFGVTQSNISAPAFSFGSAQDKTSAPGFSVGSTQEKPSDPSSFLEKKEELDSSKQKVNIFAKFAPKPGSWTCETCLVPNEADSSTCVACTAPNPSIPNKTDTTFSFDGKPNHTPSAAFSFGSTQSNTSAPAFSFGSAQDKTSAPAFSFGSTQEKPSDPSSFLEKKEELDSSKQKVNIFAKFAPKPGSWTCETCETCLVPNEADSSTCVACTAPNPSIPNKTDTTFSFDGKPNPTPSAAFNFGSTESNTSAPAFSFGSAQDKTSAPAFSFGSTQEKPSDPSSFLEKKEELDSSKQKVNIFAKFAPKPGSWTCETCLVPNEADSSTCVACTAPNPSIPNKTDTTFSFDGKLNPTPPTAFRFGSTQENTSAASFSFGLAQEKPFSFGSTYDKTSAPAFSFGFDQDKSSPASFSFGSKKQPSEPGFDTKQQGPSFGMNKTIPHEKKFEADPNTWECPSCLLKNDGYRERCRSCHNIKEKAPVVKLDPAQFSSPINFNEKFPGNVITKNPVFGSIRNNSAAVQPGNLFGSGTELPALNDTSSIFQGTKPDVSAAGFFLAKKEESDSAFWTKPHSETEAVDRVLMPPPIGFPPIKSKTPPKQNTKKPQSSKESVFSWMPQGLSTESLFTFGSTPSPSLSAASSVDDIPTHTSDEQSSVPSAFANTDFTFKLENDISAAPKTPDSKAVSSSPQTIKSPVTPKTPGDGDDNDNEAEFIAIVNLEHVVVGTGEEDEEVLFKERSKMFRFDGQWKERGIGELRILRNRTNQQHRLIMRREQIHKLCANHGLIQGMVIKPMSGNSKAFTWKTGSDISDGEVREQMFAARFKDEDTASHFAKIFEQACSSRRIDERVMTENEETESTEPDVVVISDSDDDDEVPLTDVTDVTVTFDPSLDGMLARKAKQLLLPKSFFHEPTVDFGERPSRTVGESSKASTSSTIRLRENELVRTEDEHDLILTHERITEKNAEIKASSMLLPKSFYNYEQSQTLITNEWTGYIAGGKEESEMAAVPDQNTPRPYVKTYFQREVFQGSGTLFSFLIPSEDYEEIVEGDVIILLDEKTGRTEVVVVSENNCFYQKEIASNLELTLLPDSKTMFQLKQSVGREGHVVKFTDMLTAERFQFHFEKAYEAASNQNVFGGSAKGLSFASLAVDGPSEFVSNSGKSFAGSGSSLFNLNNADNAEEEESNIFVEPIIQLSTIAVSNGEEDEAVVFNQRCKLYRFDAASKKWKERGVGNLKLLQHEESGKSRLLMRREQVGKLCANHQLQSHLKLEPFQTNELTVTWHAVADMSDTTPEDCILAARFKNQSILSEFKEKFEKLCSGEIMQVSQENLTNVDSENQVQPLFGSCDPRLMKGLEAQLHQ